MISYDIIVKEGIQKHRKKYYNNDELIIEIVKEKINNEIRKTNNKIDSIINNLKNKKLNDGLSSFNFENANDYPIRDDIEKYLPDKITLLEVIKETLDNYEKKIKVNNIEINNYIYKIYIMSFMWFLSIILIIKI
jgi:hypothetical protein